MFNYKCVFSVNTRKTEEIVYANSSVDAKKLIEARYAGNKITWWSCTKV